MIKILLIGVIIFVALTILAMLVALIRMLLSVLATFVVSLGLSALIGFLVALALGAMGIGDGTGFGAATAFAVLLPVLLAVHRFRHRKETDRSSPSGAVQGSERQQHTPVQALGETVEMAAAWISAFEMVPGDAASLEYARQICSALLVKADEGVLDIEIIDMAAVLRNHLVRLIKETQQVAEAGAAPRDDEIKAMMAVRLTAIGKKCQGLLDASANRTCESLNIRHRHLSAVIAENDGSESVPMREDKA